MAAVRSAGVIVYRRSGDDLEVLLGHMGGPFWSRKDAGAWTIPKGEYESPEDPLDAARREFEEELGVAPPRGEHIDLGEFVQSSRKSVRAFAIEGDVDPSSCVSNTFEVEWPPGSGNLQEFPEIDRVEWFLLATAREKVVKGQIQILDSLSARVG